MSDTEKIYIEYDSVNGDYFTVWNPPAALGAGKTAIEAINDMRQAVHQCIDILLDLKVEELSYNKEG